MALAEVPVEPTYVIARPEIVHEAFDEIARSNFPDFLAEERNFIQGYNFNLWRCVQEAFNTALHIRGPLAGDQAKAGLLAGHRMIRACSTNGVPPYKHIIEIKSVADDVERAVDTELRHCDPTASAEELAEIVDGSFQVGPVYEGVLARFANPSTRACARFMFKLFEPETIDLSHITGEITGDEFIPALPSPFVVTPH